MNTKIIKFKKILLQTCQIGNLISMKVKSDINLGHCLENTCSNGDKQKTVRYTVVNCEVLFAVSKDLHSPVHVDAGLGEHEEPEVHIGASSIERVVD